MILIKMAYARLNGKEMGLMLSRGFSGSHRGVGQPLLDTKELTRLERDVWMEAGWNGGRLLGKRERCGWAYTERPGREGVETRPRKVGQGPICGDLEGQTKAYELL